MPMLHGECIAGSPRFRCQQPSHARNVTQSARSYPMSRSVFGMAFPMLDKYHKFDSDAGCAKKYLHFVMLRPWTARHCSPDVMTPT